MYHRQELRTRTLYVVLVPHIVAHKPTVKYLCKCMYACAYAFIRHKYSKTFCKRIAFPDPQRRRTLHTDPDDDCGYRAGGIGLDLTVVVL